MPCPLGSFSLGGQTACTECPAGYACPDQESSDAVACASGYYSLGGAASCTICPAGSYCVSRAVDPLPCPSGTFSYEGQTTCTLATPGYYVPLWSDHSGQYKCDNGHYSTGGTTACTLCSPGYPCEAGSTEAAPSDSRCPVGFYCDPANTMTPCPRGTYGAVEAGTSVADACTACEEGFLCAAGGAISNRKVCPAGGYCTQGASEITYCSPGYMGPLTGQSSLAACELCDAGKYCPWEGHTTGLPCPPGRHCPEGTSASFACPTGTFSDVEGLNSAAQCSACPTGYYCPAASTAPVVCSAGAYNPVPYGGAFDSCLSCEAGYACPGAGMSTMTTACAPGHYCPGGTILSSQYPCPAGTMSDETDLVSQDSCSPCPAGYTCGIGSTTASLLDCRLAHYCPLGTALGDDEPCPSGTFSDIALLQGSEDCTVCPPGAYCVGGNTSVTGACPAGHFCPAGTSFPETYPCPAGYYAGNTALVSASQCIKCVPGYFCPQASVSMLPCPNGTYLTAYQGAIEESCAPCEAGYRCPIASASQLPCGVGLYSDTNASACIVCPPGSFCGSNTTASSSLYNASAQSLSGLCYAGNYCPEGTDHLPDHLTLTCPAGYYCPAGTPYLVPCPPGRYNPQTGRSGFSECLLSPAGYYVKVQGAASTTGLCAAGHFCPLGSTSSTQLPCPNGTYLPNKGGQSLEFCASCVPGGYCPLASVLPTVCPEGYFCPEGSATPQACANGTYGPTTGLQEATDCTPCYGGQYCDEFGLTSPSGLCQEGKIRLD